MTLQKHRAILNSQPGMWGSVRKFPLLEESDGSSNLNLFKHLVDGVGEPQLRRNGRLNGARLRHDLENKRI